MERLSRVAHRIVWVNPRTQSPEYRPLVGGMAAAWPYCDAVVSAHTLHALDDLTAALAHSGTAPRPGRQLGAASRPLGAASRPYARLRVPCPGLGRLCGRPGRQLNAFAVRGRARLLSAGGRRLRTGEGQRGSR